MECRPNTVAVDRLRGVYEGMTYLIKDLGHRDIALITAGARSRASHQERITGYQISLRTFNMPYRAKLEIRCQSGSQEAGEAAVHELLKRHTPFSAVFVDTDIKALGAMRALQQAGLAIPGKVSVLGFDDVPGVDRAEPPLTTIRVPHFECGVAAINLLNERLRTGKDVPGIIVNARLVVRQSCGTITGRKQT